MQPPPIRREVWKPTPDRLLEQWDETARRFTAWGYDNEILEAREYTPAENAEADQKLAAANTEAANSDTIESRLRAALVTNADWLANKARTEQDRDAHLDHLTRTVNAIIRTRYDGLLDDISDT